MKCLEEENHTGFFVHNFCAHTIKKLPADNDQYYIEHEYGTDTFKLRDDPDQKEKNDIS